MSVPSQVYQFVAEVIETLKPSKTYADLVEIKGTQIHVNGVVFDVPNKIHLFALGKASAFELSAFNALIRASDLNHRIGQCVAYTKVGHKCDDSEIIQIEGDHPFLSRRNIENTEKFISCMRDIHEEDLVIFLLSGGASALLELPRRGLSFAQLQQIHADLLNSGRNINEINEIRKSLSQVKNGGLLKQIRAQKVIQFTTCDIPDETLGDVGSGPLIYQKLNLPRVNEYLSQYSLYVDPVEPSTRKVHAVIGQSATKLLSTLASSETKRRVTKIYDCLIDEMIEDLIQNLPQRDEVQLSGGEGTLVVPENAGRGGRNTHFVLQLAQRLYQDPAQRDIHILSLGTDGTDGPTDAAGAYINFEIFTQLDEKPYLDCFNSYEYFARLGTLIKTGPTQTNVMDIRCLWREQN